MQHNRKVVHMIFAANPGLYASLTPWTVVVSTYSATIVSVVVTGSGGGGSIMALGGLM